MLCVWHKTVLPGPYIRLLRLELLVKCGSYPTLLLPIAALLKENKICLGYMLYIAKKKDFFFNINLLF